MIKRGDIVHEVDQFGMMLVRAGASLRIVTRTRGRKVWSRPVSAPHAAVDQHDRDDLAVVDDDDLDGCCVEAMVVVDVVTRELKRRAR